MTAPLLNLPIFAAAAPAGGQAAPAVDAATGFEALMAAFFATGDAEGESIAPIAANSEESEGAAATETNLGAPTAPVDAQTLAALLAVTPQAAPVAQPPSASAEAEGGEAPLQAAANAPPAAFAALMGQTVDTPATASPDVEAAAVNTAATASEAEPIVADAPAALAPEVETQPDDVAKPTSPGQERPREAQLTPAAEHAQAKGAPPPHAAPAQTAPASAAQPQQQQPLSQPVESVADAAVQAEAVAAEAEVPSEPAKTSGANRPGKSEGARRTVAPATNGAHAAVPAAPAHDAAMRPVEGAPASEIDAQALAVEGEAVAAAPAPRETKANDADAPDTPAAAAPPTPSHHASAASAEAALPVRGSPETVANLAAQIVKKLEGRSTRFDVELNPAGLGQVSVAVEIGAHGRMTAALSFETPQAAAELRARASELQKALEQAGFDLSGGALSFDVAGDRGQGRGDFGQQQQQHDGGAWRGRAFQAVLDTAGEAADAAANAALYLHRGSTSGVDVRV